MSIQEKVLDGLKSAIQAEVEGYYFYKMAVQSTQDVKGKQVFEQLAQDEKEHEGFLRRQYHAIKSTGRITTEFSLGSPREFQGGSPIFSDKVKENAANANYEMTVLAVGIQLEQSAINFYKQLAQQTEEKELADLFDDLAAWETEHYNMLLAQQQYLKEDYWTENRFSPF